MPRAPRRKLKRRLQSSVRFWSRVRMLTVGLWRRVSARKSLAQTPSTPNFSPRFRTLSASLPTPRLKGTSRKLPVSPQKLRISTRFSGTELKLLTYNLRSRLTSLRSTTGTARTLRKNRGRRHLNYTRPIARSVCNPPSKRSSRIGKSRMRDSAAYYPI